MPAGCFEAEKVMNMERDAVMRKIKCSSWNENSIMRTLSAPRRDTLARWILSDLTITVSDPISHRVSRFPWNFYPFLFLLFFLFFFLEEECARLYFLSFFSKSVFKKGDDDFNELSVSSSKSKNTEIFLKGFRLFYFVKNNNIERDIVICCTIV